MIYTKIRLDFEYGPKGRFYRVVLVNSDIDLFKLGIAFGVALGATFEHTFMFTANRKKDNYVDASIMENPIYGDKYLGNHYLRELPNIFHYCYDFGDGWDFYCKKYKKTYEINSKKELIILEGSGQGIWEDEICSLWAYFEGDVSPDETEDNEEMGIYKPWNYSINKFSDFDLPLDIDELNKIFDKEFNPSYKKLYSIEKRIIKENNICLDDCNLERVNHLLYKERLGLFNRVDINFEEDETIQEIFSRLKSIYGGDEVIAFEEMYYTLLFYKFEIDMGKKSFDKNEYIKRLKKVIKAK